MSDNLNNKIEALKSIEGMCKTLITLATGTIVFSVTIIKNGPLVFESLLVASWCCLMFSVIAGIILNGQIITHLSNGNYNIFYSWLLWPMRIQQILFSIGIISLVIHFCV